MQGHIRIVTLGLLAILHTGCASLSKQECIQGNWQSIGYTDGVRGYGSGRIEQHRKTCAEHGVSPRMDDYLEGHARGITVFCQPYRGYEYGLRGNQYRAVCPAGLDAPFRNGYQYGYGIFQLRNEVSSHYAHLKKIDTRLDENKKEIRLREKRLVSDRSNREIRIRMLEEIRHLRHKRAALKERRHGVLDRIGFLEREIETRLQNNPYAPVSTTGTL